jgi:hypothetical protein
MAISLDKLATAAPELVSLRKEVDDAVEAAALDPNHKAKVALCIDYSYSMSGAFASKLVQRVAEKVLVLGTRFDDDGDIDIFFFGDKGWRAGTLDLSNYKGGIDRLTSGKSMGSTNMSSGFAECRKAFSGRRRFGRMKRPEFPGYVLVLSDGSAEPLWWECVGIPAGRRFPFFEAVDDPIKVLADPSTDSLAKRAADILKNRSIDNAHTFAGDPDHPNLFNWMLAEYPGWVKETQGHLWG